MAAQVEGAAERLEARVQGSLVRVATATSRTGVATMTLASQRQRGDGGDPVGVTSSSRPIEVIAV